MLSVMVNILNIYKYFSPVTYFFTNVSPLLDTVALPCTPAETLAVTSAAHLIPVFHF